MIAQAEKMQTSIKLQTLLKAHNKLQIKAKAHLKSKIKNKMHMKIKSHLKLKTHSHLKHKTLNQLSAQSQEQIDSSNEAMSEMDQKIEMEDKIALENEYQNIDEGSQEFLDSLPENDRAFIQEFKDNYNKYVPMSYYELDPDSKDFNLRFREQLFRNNTKFFTIPQVLQDQYDKIAIQLGFPTSQDQKDLQDGKIPFFLQKFQSQQLNDYFKDYYMKGCYNVAFKDPVKMAKQIQKDALRFLETESVSEDQSKNTPTTSLNIKAWWKMGWFTDAEKNRKLPQKPDDPKEKPSDDKIDIPSWAQQCMIPIQMPLVQIPLYNCFASTRLDRLWRFEWWCTAGQTQIHQHLKKGRDFAGYPCTTADTGGRNFGSGAWISGPQNQPNKPITFRWEYLRVQIVHQMEIHWVGKPTEWEIEQSQDLMVWEGGVTSHDFGKKWDGSGPFIKFLKPYFCRAMKLVMSTDKMFIGIHGIKIYQKVVTQMLTLKNLPGGCLVRAEPDYFVQKADVMVMPCLDAITLGDGREAWEFSAKGEIQSQMDKYCLEMATNPGDSKIAWLQRCDFTARQKTIINRHGKIESLGTKGYCLIADEEKQKQNVAYRKEASAKSSFKSRDYVPARALDNSGSGFWLGGIDDEKNWFKVMFGNPRTIGAIVIKWKYPAAEYEILVRGEHDWEPLLNENTSQKEVSIEFQPRIASGIMIQMNRFDFALSKMPTGRYAYGISKLQVFRGGITVNWEFCGGQTKMMNNRWLFHEVGFMATCATKPNADLKAALGQQQGKLMMDIKSILKLPSQIGVLKKLVNNFNIQNQYLR